jgi:hypothetical protein
VEHFNPVMAFLEKEASRPQYITAERLGTYQVRGTEVGVVLDLMIHDIGIVLALVKSPIAKIDSVGINVLSKTEDIANARIQFENGCVANLSASRMSLKKAREIRIFQDNAYLSLDFMNQSGHLVKKSDIIAFGLKMKIGLVKAGDTSSVPVHQIPIEKGEPLALELAHFVESVAVEAAQGRGRARQERARGRDRDHRADPEEMTGPSSFRLPAPLGGAARPPGGRRRALRRRARGADGRRPPAPARPARRGPRRPEARGGGRPASLDRTRLGRRPGRGRAEPGLLQALIEETVRWVGEYRPKAVCFVDNSGVNLRIAKELRLRGISAKGGGTVRTLYYISPQIWASRADRRFDMARNLDASPSSSPSRSTATRTRASPWTFVGHPFMAPDYAPRCATTPPAPSCSFRAAGRRPWASSSRRSSAATGSSRARSRRGP